MTERNVFEDGKTFFFAANKVNCVGVINTGSNSINVSISTRMVKVFRKLFLNIDDFRLDDVSQREPFELLFCPCLNGWTCHAIKFQSLQSKQQHEKLTHTLLVV